MANQLQRSNMLKLELFTLGRGGLIAAADKKEGDGCTPLGTYPLREIWVRPDRVARPVSGLPVHEITPDDCWCDDPAYPLYNRHFRREPLLPPGEEQDLLSSQSELSKSEEGSYFPSPHQLSKDSQANPRKLTSPLKGEVKPTHHHPQNHITYAKQLRQNATDVEKKLWYAIRNRQICNAKFRRQQPIGPYIADYVCLQKKLIIELDGGQHADSESDKKRDDFLSSEGFRVLRFRNNEVLQNMDGVLEVISSTLDKTTATTTPHQKAKRTRSQAFLPLPQGERLPLENIPASYECLWREDHAYDVIVVIGYNDDPVLQGKGSAIFIHLEHDDGRPTAGCVALPKEALLALCSQLTSNSEIHITREAIYIE